MLGGADERGAVQGGFVGVGPALGVAELLGPALVAFQGAGCGAFHDPHDVVPLAVELGGAVEGRADVAHPPQVVGEGPLDVVGAGGGGADAGQDFGAVGEEDLDVLPCGGVAGHLAVLVALDVDGPAVLRVAEGVRDPVPVVDRLGDAGGSGGQGRQVPPPRQRVGGRRRPVLGR
ncbi:MAG TPA: hypothetical protein DD420_04580, partial [Streptomyces sp.]|nr:hypothetical protein [Streptomyces sp.]